MTLPEPMPEALLGDTEVKIWQVKHYYNSNTTKQNHEIDCYVRGEDVDSQSNDYEPYKFATYADAQAWINERNSKVYVLDHNEVERPDYYIVN